MDQSFKAPELKKPTPAVPTHIHSNSALRVFFIDALKDIYWAEKELVKALPKNIEAVTTAELKEAITEHLAQTRTHVTRIEDIFQIMNEPAEAKVCFAMQGLLKEAESITGETEEGSVTRDAAIILAAQKIEHYEIASYGALAEYAKTIGLNDVHGLVHLTLEEERMADQGLTLLAQNKINWEAEIRS